MRIAKKAAHSRVCAEPTTRSRTVFREVTLRVTRSARPDRFHAGQGRDALRCSTRFFRFVTHHGLDVHARGVATMRALRRGLFAVPDAFSGDVSQ